MSRPHSRDSESVRIDVPFYRQHYSFTCGPASLMMVMKYFNRKMRLSKELEIDIWREANMVEVYGTSRYGLAYSAVVRGYKARVMSNIRGYEFVDKLQPEVKGIDRRMLRVLFDERRRRCLKLGVKDERATITPEVVRGALASGLPPLLLTSAEWFSGEDLPHWVVVTGFGERGARINNPLDSRPHAEIGADSFSKMLSYKGDQCVVVIDQ